MATAEILLRSKGREVITVSPHASIFDAARLMNEHHIGSLVVCEDDCLVGIVTERDVLRRVVAAHRDPLTTTVGDVMTRAVACAEPRTLLNEIRQAMRDRKIRHMPVIDERDRAIGMISIGDLNRAEHDQQEETIRYLEQYMTCP